MRSRVVLLIAAAAAAVTSAVAVGVAAQKTPHPPPQADTIARMRQWVGTECPLHQSDHFIVAAGATCMTASALADLAEQTYSAVQEFAEALGLPIESSHDRLGVVMFATEHEFREATRRRAVAVPKTAVGAYDHRSNLCLFANPADLAPIRKLDRAIRHAEDVARDQQTGGDKASAAQSAQLAALRRQRDELVDRVTGLVVRHELAHQTLYNLSIIPRRGDPPSWIVEGLAMQFEDHASAARSAAPGMNLLRLADLQLALPPNATTHPDADRSADEERSRECARELRALVSLAPAINTDHALTARQYAQAWGLVFYLKQTKPRLFAKYLQTFAADTKPLNQGDLLARFQRHFGTLDAAFVRGWLEHMGLTKHHGD